jgi:uncharacterized repeat protein (TIGR02543 family)
MTNTFIGGTTACTATTYGGGLFIEGTFTATTFTATNSTITNCSAQNGAAVYVNSGSYTMSGGKISRNNATIGGAVQTSSSGVVRFRGSAKVKNNMYNGESGHNIYLDADRNNSIYGDGLADDAELYVYVVDGQKGRHGYSGRTFGTYTNTSNLNCFMNERFKNSSGDFLCGTVLAGFEGEKLICWPGEDVVLTVVSAEDNSTPVADAWFELTRNGWDGNALIWRGKTDENGVVRIPWTQNETLFTGGANDIGGGASFLSDKSYELKQIKTGTGFALPGGKWTISNNTANGLTSVVSQTSKTNRAYNISISGTNLERNNWQLQNDVDTMRVQYVMNGDGAAFEDPALDNPQTVHFTNQESAIGDETAYPGPVREGYLFIGWNTAANGINGVGYGAGGPLYHTSNESGGVLTLYAQWAQGDPIARVSTDEKNWTYYGELVTGDANTGAFDKAKSYGSGTGYIELLYETHEKYTITQSIVFGTGSGRANIVIRPIASLGGKSTLVKGNFDAPMIVFNNGSRSLTLTDLVFDGASYATNGTGGILRRSTGSTLTINDCDFKNCIASGDGGAVYWASTVDINHTKGGDMLFENCQSTGGSGGAINAQGSTVSISNTGVGTVKFDNCQAGASGGALYTTGQMTLNDNTGKILFSDNKALGGSGGAFHVGYFNANNNRGTIAFDGCTASSNGGAVHISSSTASTINNNVGGITFDRCSAGASGGALSFTRALNADTNTGEISFTDCTAASSGGGIYSSNTSYSFTASSKGRGKISFTGCTAGTNGGGIYYGYCNINGASADNTTSFTNCTAGSGGGIYIVNTATLTNATFGKSSDTSKACAASANGGGVYAGSGSFNTVSFYNCTANNAGGVWFNSGSNTLTNCIITGCSATTKASAVHMEGSSSLTFSGGSYTGNYSNGGAVTATSNSSSTHIFLQGNVVIYDNYTSSGDEQKNIVLSLDRNTVIETNSTGLGSNAKVGIYTTDGTVYNNHGKADLLFGTYGSAANLNNLINDRNTKLKGCALGSNIGWGGDGICKLTDSNDTILYKSNLGVYAVYGTIQAAFADINNGSKLYSKSADGSYKSYTGAVKLKLLRDIVMDGNDVPTYTIARNLTITTAELEKDRIDDFPYVREENAYGDLREEGWASIKRGRDGTSLFTIKPGGGVIKFENLLFDGDNRSFTGSGNAIYITNCASTEIHDCTFVNMKAANGGAVYSTKPLTISATEGHAVTFKNCSVTGAGGTIYASAAVSMNNNEGIIQFHNSKANGDGGAVYLSYTSLTMSNNKGTIEFLNCSTKNNDCEGGAIDASYSLIAENNAGMIRFKGCHTNDTTTTYSSEGGAIFCCQNLTLTCTGSGTAEFIDCFANALDGGGAICMWDSSAYTLTIRGSADNPIRFENCYNTNSSNGKGGAIYQNNGKSKTISNAVFEGCHNSNTGHGGAICQNPTNSTLTLTNVTFGALKEDGTVNADSACKSNQRGGAIYTNANTTSFTDCNFYGNTASTGGAVYYNGRTNVIKNCTAIGNTAAKGAAIYLANSKGLTFDGGRYTGNVATNSAGGAVNVGGTAAKLYFDNDVYINGNTDSSNSQHNVVLEHDTNGIINTTKTGLGEDAMIGVYVTDTLMSKHGEQKCEFGTFNSKIDNLDAFKNDRRSLVGGEKGTSTIAWSTAYTLMLDPNGGEGEPVSVILSYFKEYTLGEPYTKEGYYFGGWNTRKDGSGENYAAQDIVSQLTDVDGGVVTLYAQWEEYDPCNIYFHPNGGEAVPSRTVKPGTKLGLLPSSEREHYTFVRWMLINENGEEESYSQDTIVNTDLHFYATWEKRVTITFDAQGGIVGEDEREIAPGKIGSLPMTEQPAATKKDYEFVRWYQIDEEGNHVTVTADTSFTSDETIYAEWRVIKRRLRYDTAGGYPGKNYSTNDYWYTDYTDDLATIKEYPVMWFPEVTNHGYTLDGWYTPQGKKVGLGSTVNLQEVSYLRAKWIKTERVIVTFDSDGGSACAAIEVVPGDSVDRYPVPTKNGYVFSGWYLLDGEGGFAQEDGHDIEVTALTPVNENITVKAKWESMATVTFDSDGGSACDAIKVQRGRRISAYPTPTKQGYFFMGWYLAESSVDPVTGNTVVSITEPETEVDNWTVINDDIT